MDRLIYDRNLMEMAASLEESDRRKFIDIVQRETQNPVELFGWNMWLGFFGIDRFIVGDVGLGILKLITFGGMGIWQIVDCFLIGNRTRTKNWEKILDIYHFVKNGPE
ncbi:MAG: TM2 domain-containing protein [Hellea sp.]